MAEIIICPNCGAEFEDSEEPSARQENRVPQSPFSKRDQRKATIQAPTQPRTDSRLARRIPCSPCGGTGQICPPLPIPKRLLCPHRGGKKTGNRVRRRPTP